MTLSDFKLEIRKSKYTEPCVNIMLSMKMGEICVTVIAMDALAVTLRIKCNNNVLRQN